MTSHPTRDLALINAAGFLRSFGVGMMGVLLGIYLFRAGLTSLAIGLIIAVGLAGAALATILVSLAADRVGRRSSLLILSLLSGVAGIAFVVSPRLPVLAILAFVGMLNGTGTDRSAAAALDQAIIPGLVSDIKRTWSLAWYNVLLDGGGALGAMAAALPIVLRRQLSVLILRSYRLVFFGYFGLCLALAALYLFLSPAVEVVNPAGLAPTRTKIARDSRRIVGKLTALFSLDAFGGGFLTDALVAYWFFRRCVWGGAIYAFPSPTGF